MTRRIYACLAALFAAVIVFIALFVRDDFIRPYGGDVLVTVLICCAVRVVFLRLPLLPLWVFLFAAGVEIGQAFGLVDLLGLGHITFFRIALGTTYSTADLLCYAVGCALFWAAEARAALTARNLAHNRALAEVAEACRGEDSLYHGQCRPGLDAMRFGYYSVGRSGCGPIGICNALCRCGIERPLPEVIASAEIGIPFFGAMIGLSPLAIPFILRRLLHRSDYHGLRVRYRLRLPDHLPPDGVLILTHFNSRRLRDGAHTVTLYAEGDEICVANVYGRSTAPIRYSTPAAYLRGRRMLGAVMVTPRAGKPYKQGD